AGVFSIAATMVSLLLLPLVLLGFTLFHHSDVSCDRERASGGTRRFAICFDTSNVPRETNNQEHIQHVVTAANTARSSLPALAQPANENINVDAEAQRPGIGGRVHRARQSDSGVSSAMCFGVESICSS
ncbi:MAG: hypothetical protein PV344_05585, partial [Anaplasma sp.]|nr:hypothetical protein [Anaplasma sp.]